MRSSLQMRRCLACFAATVAAHSISFVAVPADNPRERAEILAATAEKILNTWQGEPEIVARAVKLIDEALALNPNSGHALVESGRAILMSDPCCSGYSQRAVQTAIPLFVKATELHPPYGRGYVLMGHVYTEIGQLEQARKALTMADGLVPDDPWLKLNWGAYHAALGQGDKQASYAEQAIATGTTNPKALRAAYDIVIKSEVRKGNRARADAIYAKYVEAQPHHPWVRGNYANNVLIYFGDFVTGEKLAREALQLMDYPHARGSLSLALYGQWAQAEKDGKAPAEVERLFDIAYRNDPGGHDLPACAVGNQRVGFVFDALFRKGVERRSLRRC
jgi:tetratricopeptide (TPR) repeat protein